MINSCSCFIIDYFILAKICIIVRWCFIISIQLFVFVHQPWRQRWILDCPTGASFSLLLVCKHVVYYYLPKKSRNPKYYRHTYNQTFFVDILSLRCAIIFFYCILDSDWSVIWLCSQIFYLMTIQIIKMYESMYILVGFFTIHCLVWHFFSQNRVI